MPKIDFIIDKFPNNVYNTSKTSNLYKFLNSFGSKLDEFLDNMDNVKNSRYVNYSSGAELDNIGKLINLNRFLNESDDSYRGRIKTKIPSFIGGGTISSIKQVIEKYLGITPTIIEHYKSGEGHPYFDNGVFNGLDASITGLTLSIKSGISYIEGSKITSVDKDIILSSYSSNRIDYIFLQNDGTFITKTNDSTYNSSTQIPLYEINVTSSSLTSSNITDNRKILDPYNDFITNTTSITVQIPYNFSEGYLTIDDTMNILKNTAGAGIALLLKVIGTYDESITFTENIQSYFLVGFSGIGSSNLIGG